MCFANVGTESSKLGNLLRWAAKLELEGSKSAGLQSPCLPTSLNSPDSVGPWQHPELSETMKNYWRKRATCCLVSGYWFIHPSNQCSCACYVAQPFGFSSLRSLALGKTFLQDNFCGSVGAALLLKDPRALLRGLREADHAVQSKYPRLWPQIIMAFGDWPEILRTYTDEKREACMGYLPKVSQPVNGKARTPILY